MYLVLYLSILGGINCYYVIPFVKIVLAAGLSNAATIFNNLISLIEKTSVKLDNSETLSTRDI